MLLFLYVCKQTFHKSRVHISKSTQNTMYQSKKNYKSWPESCLSGQMALLQGLQSTGIFQKITVGVIEYTSSIEYLFWNCICYKMQELARWTTEDQATWHLLKGTIADADTNIIESQLVLKLFFALGLG